MPEKLTERFVKSAPIKEKPYEVFDTELRGLLFRVQPSGHKSFYVQYTTPGGKHRRHRLGTADAVSVAQARDAAREYMASVQQGKDPVE
ncbi:MAG: DUF4102 domain-containing protein, partial [Candidatus Hydrogenedentes bacterium]|nr:DUF4102 domain-containing protein [Candidatus Hydrogenedentota bacterium]